MKLKWILVLWKVCLAARVHSDAAMHSIAQMALVERGMHAILGVLSKCVPQIVSNILLRLKSESELDHSPNAF